MWMWMRMRIEMVRSLYTYPTAAQPIDEVCTYVTYSRKLDRSPQYPTAERQLVIRPTIIFDRSSSRIWHTSVSISIVKVTMSMSLGYEM